MKFNQFITMLAICIMQIMYEGVTAMDGGVDMMYDGKYHQQRHQEEENLWRKENEERERVAWARPLKKRDDSGGAIDPNPPPPSPVNPPGPGNSPPSGKSLKHWAVPFVAGVGVGVAGTHLKQRLLGDNSSPTNTVEGTTDQDTTCEELTDQDTMDGVIGRIVYILCGVTISFFLVGSALILYRRRGYRGEGMSR